MIAEWMTSQANWSKYDSYSSKDSAGDVDSETTSDLEKHENQVNILGYIHLKSNTFCIVHYLHLHGFKYSPNFSIAS